MHLFVSHGHKQGFPSEKHFQFVLSLVQLYNCFCLLCTRRKLYDAREFYLKLQIYALIMPAPPFTLPPPLGTGRVNHFPQLPAPLPHIYIPHPPFPSYLLHPPHPLLYKSLILILL